MPEKHITTMGGGWSWLRTVSNEGFRIRGVETSASGTRVRITCRGYLV
jgi:hypothetical protein